MKTKATGTGFDGIPAAGSAAISIVGAREHNLKNISLAIPRNQFVVITGVSGSGKSTLAFDLLFAEGQRRFLDSMNAYARQFVDQMARPEVDLIAGLPPTVSIEQRTTRGGGKSTVATVTEVHHFLRLLFARLGVTFCPDCQTRVEGQTRDQLRNSLARELRKRGDLLLLAPVVRNRKGFHTDVAEWAARHGYAEIRADGKIHRSDQPFRLDRFREHDVEVVIGVLDRKTARRVPAGRPARAASSRPLAATAGDLIGTALEVGHGVVLALDNHGRTTVHSTERACPDCGRSFPPLDPKNFSYNSAQGWCPRCRGFGELFYLPDVERGANAEAIEESWYSWAEDREICPECRGTRLNPLARAVRLPVPGKRTRNEEDGGPTIATFGELSVRDTSVWFRQHHFSGREGLIARDIVPEILSRLRFLEEVGLTYLELGRGVTTLSGGEAQRIRLAAQLGSNLSGVLYVLDEPTIGLHARDNQQLLAALNVLRGRGNSVVVVEHDEATMRQADHIIDLGPGAGLHGGEVVAAGKLRDLIHNEKSVTGVCLKKRTRYPSRGQRRAIKFQAGQASGGASYTSPQSVHSGLRGSVALPESGLAMTEHDPEVCPTLVLHHAALHNLKDLTVPIPLNRFVVVTGVSGSGKSTLVRECLLPAVTRVLNGKAAVRKGQGSEPSPGLCRVTGFESLAAVHEVDQSPIGRTPRSTPATYVGFFDEIRRLFAQAPEARLRGYGPGRFSFNSAQGRCAACEGTGTIKLEMNFLPPAFVRCETCEGTRFTPETLDIQFKGRNIAQVLEMTVEEAMAFFNPFPKIRRPLEALHDTGLDYLKLGQTSPTLSGGEAQRVKLVSHLLGGMVRQETADLRTIRRVPRRSLFILEEPTIGLHMADVTRLVEVLQRLVDAGHSVIVIEHNLDLIAEADWVIDLGPEAGSAGGRIVVEGPPEKVARSGRSHTGRYLRDLLGGRGQQAAQRKRLSS